MECFVPQAPAARCRCLVMAECRELRGTAFRPPVSVNEWHSIGKTARLTYFTFQVSAGELSRRARP